MPPPGKELPDLAATRAGGAAEAGSRAEPEAPEARFERATCALGKRCSIQLSYPGTPGVYGWAGVGVARAHTS